MGREDDAAEKGTNGGVRVFTLVKVCFIYKHVLMGPWSGMAPSKLLDFWRCK
jgi:hypothetical protein